MIDNQSPTAKTKTPMVKPEFSPTGGGNYVLDLHSKRDWIVSYNPNTRNSQSARLITNFLNALSEKECYDGEETALELEEKWYILEGDYRKQILQAYKKDLKAVAKVFLKNFDDHPYSTGTKSSLQKSISKLP